MPLHDENNLGFGDENEEQIEWQEDTGGDIESSEKEELEEEDEVEDEEMEEDDLEDELSEEEKKKEYEYRRCVEKARDLALGLHKRVDRRYLEVALGESWWELLNCTYEVIRRLDGVLRGWINDGGGDRIVNNDEEEFSKVYCLLERAFSIVSSISDTPQGSRRSVPASVPALKRALNRLTRIERAKGVLLRRINEIVGQLP